jgi:hypothetical protein
MLFPFVFLDVLRCLSIHREEKFFVWYFIRCDERKAKSSAMIPTTKFQRYLRVITIINCIPIEALQKVSLKRIPSDSQSIAKNCFEIYSPLALQAWFIEIRAPTSSKYAELEFLEGDGAMERWSGKGRKAHAGNQRRSCFRARTTTKKISFLRLMRDAGYVPVSAVAKSEWGE